MQLGAAGEAFDGLDAAALALDRQHEAGELRLAVEQHGAGAALAELAAVLGAGEREVLAQDLEQRLVRGEGRLHRLAVDAQIQLDVPLHRRFQIVRTPNKLGPTLLPKPLWRTGWGQRYDFYSPLTPHPLFRHHSPGEQTHDATHRRRGPQFQGRDHAGPDRFPQLDRQWLRDPVLASE